MKNKALFILLAVFLAVSICGNIYQFSRPGPDAGEEFAPVGEEEEEYIYLAVFKDDSMILEQDLKGLEAFGREYGVKATISAPESYDVIAMMKLIDEAIAKKPAGLMICGSENVLTQYVNKAVEAGIPTVTVDTDLPDSERLAFVGSDWYQIGVRQAEALVKLVGGKGIVATFGILGADNTENALDGFYSVMDEYDDIIVLDMYDDVSNPEEAQRLMNEALEQYPDIVGVAGFDSNSAAGICAALRERDRLGDVKVVSVDMTSSHVELLREGAVQQLVGQKRELFAYYGGKLLYDYNHGSVEILNNKKSMPISNIPEYVNTGLVVMGPDDVPV